MRSIDIVAATTLLVASASNVQAQGPELLWELGGPMAPAHAAWTRITDAALVGDRIVVVDPVVAEVRMFTLQGEFAGNVGREGQGPGEFVIPISVRLWGDTLAIYDLGQRRWSLFDARGDHLGTTKAGHPDVSLQWATRLRGGRYVGETAWVNRQGTEYPYALLTWTDSSRVDTLRTFSTGNLRFRIGDAPRWHSSTHTVGRGGGVSFLGDSVMVLLDGLEPSLHFYDVSRSGVELSVAYPLPGAPEEISSEERQAIEDYLADDSHLSEVRAPDSIPAWTEVNAGTGSLWVRRRRQPRWTRSQRESWVEWSRDQGLRRTLDFPPGVHVIRIVRGQAIAVRHDELDVPYLQLYRVQ